MPIAPRLLSCAALRWSGPDVGPLELGGAENAPHKTKARLQQSGSVNYGRSVSQTVLAGEAVFAARRNAWRPAAIRRNMPRAMRCGAAGVRLCDWIRRGS